MLDLLTVDEVAAQLRTTRTTVYRWLHTGKLQGVKIGKEWRIHADTLANPVSFDHGTDTNTATGHSTDDALASTHTLALCEHQDDVYAVEAVFFKEAIKNNCQMMKGCWWQQPDELSENFARHGLDFERLKQEELLTVVDLKTAYLEGGTRAAVGLWKQAIANRRTQTLWAAGSPAPQCYVKGGTASMMSFESQLDRALQNQPVVGLCTYSVEDLGEGAFNLVAALAHHHSSLVFYADDQLVSFSASPFL